ncbi:MAG: phage holin family protein [Patescibacteria group bacterium]
MKRIFRGFLVEISVLYLVSQAIGGMYFEKGIESLIITGVALALATFVVKPIINILLLPLNLITFGVFRWLSQTITLFLVDLALQDFSIVAFDFVGYSTSYIEVPPIHTVNVWLAYVLFSLVISIFAGIIYWIVK